MCVQLERKRERKGETIERTAFPAYGEKMLFPTQLFSEIGGAHKYRVDGRSGVAAIYRVLDDGRGAKLSEHLTGERLLGAGRVLFEAVFGPDEAAWKPCLQRLFGDGSTAPQRHRVRLRVVTNDPQLQAMPWGIMAFGDDYLRDYGWTFEVGTEVAPRGDVELSLPTGVLLILPQLRAKDDDTASASHRDALLEIVAQYMPDHHPSQIRIAQTRDDVGRALANWQPTIVYYYGHGEVTDGQSHVPASPAPGSTVRSTPEKRLIAVGCRRLSSLRTGTTMNSERAFSLPIATPSGTLKRSSSRSRALGSTGGRSAKRPVTSRVTRENFSRTSGRRKSL